MLVILLFVIIPTTDATLLFTTTRNCTTWRYHDEWKQIGYIPVCMEDARIMQLVHLYCPSRGKPQHLIQYADIARLLVLYENGGWYVDHDVIPTKRCAITKAFSETTFGLESDFGRPALAKLYKMHRKSLALWSIYGVRNDTRLLRMACILAKRQNEGER